MTAQRMLRVLDVFGARRIASGVAVAAAIGVSLAASGIVGKFSEEAALRRADAFRATDEATRELEHLAFVQPLLSQQSRELEIAKGESLALALARAGIGWSEINPITAVVGEVFNPRRMRAGEAIQLFYATGEEGVRLAGLAFRSDPGASVTVSRRSDGAFVARELLVPVTYDVARLVASVDSSIYQAALAGGATEREVASLADAFAYDIDFQREVRPGDSFELVFERFLDEDGQTVRTGEVLFAAMRTRTGHKEYFRFQAPGDTGFDWYDAKGVSSRKFLMRTPVNGARLSSGFGVRRHPILGYTRAHKGADFAAPSGTPIMAAGDGVVRRAGVFGGYGNYVRIKHGEGYETAYAHLSRYAKGIRNGARVRQGQVIGYVGSTGRSTGPHLHYEVLQHGRHVNPMGLKVRTGRTLTAEALALFEAEKARIEALRTGEPGAGATLLAAAATTGRLN